MEPFGTSVVRDEIREEVGGRESSMGVLDIDLIVSHVPIVIPKLAVLIRLIVHGGFVADALTWKLTWKVYLPGDRIETPAFEAKDELAGSGPRDLRAPSADWRDQDVTTLRQFDRSAVFSPVRIKHEGLIKVLVDVGGITVKAGVLRVHTSREGR